MKKKKKKKTYKTGTEIRSMVLKTIYESEIKIRVNNSHFNVQESFLAF